MELVIISPKDDQFISEITFNFDELKRDLVERLKKYQGLVYSDKNIKDAKADRTLLNKFRTAIESKRIDVKKQVLLPYESFEKQVKELVLLVDAQIEEIDVQIKGYEQGEKDKKKADIQVFYEDNMHELKELVPLERVFEQRWLNATCRMEEVETIIINLYDKVSADIDAINGLSSKYELQMKDVYVRTLDLSAAINEGNRLESQENKLKEYEQAKAPLPPPPPPPESAVIKKHVKPAPAQKEPAAANGAETYQLDFRVWGTREQISSLKKFLMDNKIKFGKVE